ncbi:PREDICTED: uncharacterized protein LOC104608996 isoform X2 [Nelumbo nucifera]|uniref:Uncharacterized protein LOC104608996 isoform X2 n=1 Tax=Nelumbo nucifera TaxID=4432 RepID=A0A1U8Q900_NELNU|nr:PREDICTED: uncharacterized protein LOC104608996 isoform X2 [Nelumbo nucifera]
MEENTEDSGGFSAMNDETLSEVFSHLKPYCLELLELLQNPKKNVKAVSELAEFLRRAPPDALQPFLHYILFPLLLLLDAAVSCRSAQKADSDTKSPNIPKMMNTVSDSVAEGVLLCLEELLKKCHLGSVNQMVVVLKKLTYGAMLSPSAAAEEFREGIVRSLRAMLLRLPPCSIESCICKRIPGLPASIESSGLQFPPFIPSKYHSEPEECLLAFLQSQNASSAVGHWLSLLLTIAENEAVRGHRGSAKLRIEAFLTLRVLVCKVGTADALAFFLPGVVSKFAKVLHVSRIMISGAAGSVEAVEQALRGLAEFLMIVLEDEANLSRFNMSINDINGFCEDKDNSSQSLLEALRHLCSSAERQTETLTGASIGQTVATVSTKFDLKENRSPDSSNITESFYVNRVEGWIEETSVHVDKLLSATFPHLVIHPSKKVRRALIGAIQGLLSKCHNTLRKSRLMLLECLCALVCDDSEEVSLAAQEFLESFFILDERHHMEGEVAALLSRLLDKLPKVVLGSDETIAVSHAQRLLALIYYAGPQIVMDHFLCSPVAAARLLDVLALCLSQNSVFAGSLGNLISAKTSSIGYLHSVAELKPSRLLCSADQAMIIASPSDIAQTTGFQDSRHEVSLSIITDIPLHHLRKLIAEVRMKQYCKESWHSWYARTGSGQLLREASTAVCILNEMIYGMSEQSINTYTRLFQKSRMKSENTRGYVDVRYADSHPNQHECAASDKSVWKVCQGEDTRNQLIDCIGRILNEYFSPEVWDLPIDQEHSLLETACEAENINLHLFRDTAMLHQVIIDGIGIFNLCLGKDFASSGFLHSSLYMLLENLICSCSQIRNASDDVLRVLSASSGYPTVGCLVVANADYIIDSLCRQLRHLDINPHVPNVLATMLSYIGVAHEILPLLEEPMRSVSLELEVLGRHQHPDLTMPFLKAVAEIAKATKHEACLMPTQAKSLFTDVKSKVSRLEKTRKDHKNFISHDNGDTELYSRELDTDALSNELDLNLEKWEKMLFQLNESCNYRRTIGSLASSCLAAATPLLASVKDKECLVTLDIVEDGIVTLSKVEEAYKHERETKVAIERAIELCSFHDFQDTLDASNEGTDENRLLPAMNRIWPYLVACIKNTQPVAVRRCLAVVSNAVQICGGDFFCRRFQNDGRHFWKLLMTSPFQGKLKLREAMPLQLPYRTTSSEDPIAEVSSLKVQTSALHMIADLSRNKRSASALEVVLKKVSGLVVGIACSGVIGLRDASINALLGLACIDPDLIWLLLADLYYSLKKKELPSPPTSDFPEIFHLLPPPLSSKDFLYVQYGGESFGFDVSFSSVEIVFQKLHQEVFNLQNMQALQIPNQGGSRGT